MNRVCVVQARLGSTRLPGKVLADVGGGPLLGLVLARLARLEVDRIVVATGEDAGDDAVAEVAAESGAAVVRGPEEDVLARFLAVLDRFPATTVVRITADCPFVDEALVAQALSVQEDTGADYVSNTLVRTYPDGLDVEVVDARALRAAGEEAVDPVEREHVTPFVYRRPERFTLRSFRHPVPLGHLRWTVDTAADLERVRRIVRRLGRSDFGWEDALAVVPPSERAGPVARGGVTLVPAGPDDAATVLALRNDRDAVRWSRTGRPVGGAEHASWFAARQHDPAGRVWLAVEGDERVGSVRLDVEGGVGTVGLIVDPRHRGRGVGTRTLRALQSALAADHQADTLVALVHVGNEASQRAFRAAGFEGDDREGEFVTLRWERRQVPASTDAT